MSGSLLAGEGETIDFILDGRMRVIQREHGYRFSIDALLLAHFASLRDGDDVIEFGTGSGVVSIILAGRPGLGRMAAVEKQAGLYGMACRNAALNGLAGRLEILQGDVRFPQTLCPPQTFSVALFNPPYRRIHSGRTNVDPEKAAARHEINGTVADFISAAAFALRPGGRMYVVYPAVRTAELTVQMRACRIEPKRLLPVYSHRGASAVFILVEGVKGGGEGLKMTAPLFIYEGKSLYSEQMKALFKDLSSFGLRDGG
jgi:tRNA1Val (adenine37-N6)-methyltransferase